MEHLQQALADFVAETSFKFADSELGKRKRVDPQRNPRRYRVRSRSIQRLKGRPQEIWTLFVNGSASKLLSGAGIHLIAPCGEKFERDLRFKFEASNNQVEYEAIIAGIELAKDIGVPSIEVNSDSQLIINQIKGEYDTNNPILANYCGLAKTFLKNLK